MTKCYLCPNNCGIDRSERDGLCHADNDMRVSRIAPHFYEEPVISGQNGSGTVFFSGCGLDCVFCQNHEISKLKVGRVYSPSELADEIKRLVDTGVHNINFVTPTHFSDKIIETLKLYRPTVPVVYNTSGYEKVEIIKELDNYVDIYLTDFKYSDNAVAEKYSRRKNYFDYCLAATDAMVESKPIIYGKDGLMKQGVIVRHLILPTEIENTLKVIGLFAERWKSRAVLSLMSQFFPTYNTTITRTLKPVEYKLAVSEALKYGIEDCFIQELDSASEFYVPQFQV